MKRRFSKKAVHKKNVDEDEVIDDPAEPNVRTPLIILYYLGFDSFLILFGLLGGAITGATPIVLYLILGDLIDGLSATTAASTSVIVNAAAGLRLMTSFQTLVNRCATYLAIVAAVSWLGAWLQQAAMHLAHDRFGNRLKVAYFNALLDQEIGYFDIKRTGQLVSEMADTEVIQDAYTNKLGEIGKFLVQGILGVIFAIIAGWKMALVMMSIAPLLLVFLVGVGAVTKMFTGAITTRVTAAAAVANEVISAMRTVRSMDGEEKEKARYIRRLKSAEPWFILKALALGLTVGILSFFIWGDIALGFWYGGQLSVRGEMTVGDMMQVFGLTLIAVIGLLMSLQLLPDLSKADPAIKNLLKVILRKPVLRPSGGITPNKIEGNISFRNVNFTYPSRPGVQVLKDFSLEIKPGQAVALVGSSGSGKSTIVGLLEKFYEADSGVIELDGVNLADIDPRWIHKNIGIVTQEPTLFAGTLRENILYAVSDKEVSQEEIERACIAANAHDFITQLPDGYNTMMGERGVSLSGGQKQRIAIARAMIQNPSLLLLDEATSALDTQSEGIVQDALEKLMQGRTSIVIAHRLSTIVNSDVIVVMHKGELKEKGTHQELLQIHDGYYARLAKKQMDFGAAAAAKLAAPAAQVKQEE